MRSFIARAIILGGAAIAISAPALAQTPFSGPYVGAQVGWQQDKFGATLGQGVEQLRGSENSDG